MKPSHQRAPDRVDESAESEITIQPDGRIFAFGITGPLARVLATLPTSDERTARLLARIGRLSARPDSPASPSVQETE